MGPRAELDVPVSDYDVDLDLDDVDVDDASTIAGANKNVLDE